MSRTCRAVGSLVTLDMAECTCPWPVQMLLYPGTPRLTAALWRSHLGTDSGPLGGSALCPPDAFWLPESPVFPHMPSVPVSTVLPELDQPHSHWEPDEVGACACPSVAPPPPTGQVEVCFELCALTPHRTDN